MERLALPDAARPALDGLEEIPVNDKDPWAPLQSNLLSARFMEGSDADRQLFMEKWDDSTATIPSCSPASMPRRAPHGHPPTLSGKSNGMRHGHLS